MGRPQRIRRYSPASINGLTVLSQGEVVWLNGLNGLMWLTDQVVKSSLMLYGSVLNNEQSILSTSESKKREKDFTSLVSSLEVNMS